MSEDFWKGVVIATLLIFIGIIVYLQGRTDAEANKHLCYQWEVNINGDKICVDWSK